MIYLLRTYKVIICSFLLIFFYGVSSLPIYAETIHTDETKFEYDIFEMEQDFMEDFKDLGDFTDVKIKIYNEENRLVRCGSEKNEMIKDLIKRADFLADVGGIEFYRLNK